MSEQEEDTVNFENTEEVIEKLQAVREVNMQRLQAIHQGGATLDPTTIIMTRIDTLLEFLPPDTRVQVEYMFEKKMEVLLREAGSEVTRNSLAVNPPNTLLIPGK